MCFQKACSSCVDTFCSPACTPYVVMVADPRIPPMPRVKSNGIELEYDTFGSPDDPALLLIMGFTAQMTAWEETFCEQIASNGFHVIRFDNRDVGLSSRLEGDVDIAKLFSGELDSVP